MKKFSMFRNMHSLPYKEMDPTSHNEVDLTSIPCEGEDERIPSHFKREESRTQKEIGTLKMTG